MSLTITSPGDAASIHEPKQGGNLKAKLYLLNNTEKKTELRNIFQIKSEFKFISCKTLNNIYSKVHWTHEGLFLKFAVKGKISYRTA